MMLSRLANLIGGQALRQRDLRMLTIAVFLTEMGVSIAFPLRMLYAQAHHATPVQLGMIAAVFFISTIIVQVPMGWLVDRWGRVPVILLGTISHAAIGVAYIFFNSPAEMIVLRFLEGASMAAVQPATFAYAADVTPEDRRAEAYGLLAAAMSGGLLIGPMIGGIVSQGSGFGAAYVFSAGIETCAALLVLAYLHEPARHLPPARQESDSTWSRLITLPLIGAYASFFCYQMVMGIFSALWTIWTRDLGASYTYIGATYTVFALPQVFLGAIAGRVSDRWGQAPVLLSAGLLISLVYASYGFVTSLGLIIALGIIEGIFLVFQQPAARSLLAEASPDDLRGRVQGVAGLAGAIGGAGSAFWSLPLYHQNRAAPFVIAGMVMAVGSLISTVSAVSLAHRDAPIVRRDVVAHSADA
jgi:MFS family permease